jgi:enamine deaminase RidA (YjgF/YER057c/UK114 family)
MEIHRSPLVVAGKSRGYAKATKAIGAKGFVWLSGVVGFDPNTGEIPEGIGEQTKLTMQNIKSRLEEYGTSLKNITLLRLYFKGEFPDGIFNDPKYPECAAVIEEFWRENCPEFLRENNPPAMTVIGVTALARPQLLLEIDVVAAVE